MIGIKEVAVYRPGGAVQVEEVARALSVPASFALDKIGIAELSRLGEGEDTSDLAAAAVRKLFENSGLRAEDVECLILITQNPDGGGLPHTSAVLHAKLGLPAACLVFDVSLGCSGYVQGLAIAKSLMEAQGLRHGLLVTADPYSKIVDMADRDTAMIFGDGAAATWMSDSAVWDIGACDFGIDSASHRALEVNEDGRLFMNGRAVFNFAASEVPKSVARVLERSQLTMAEIDCVLLHQGSRFIVETIAKRIGAEGKAPFCAAQYGNTVSSSIPTMLAENLSADVSRLLLSGFGVGLSWATAILGRRT